MIYHLPEEELPQSRLAIRSKHHNRSTIYLGRDEKTSRLQTLGCLWEFGVTIRCTRSSNRAIQPEWIDLHPWQSGIKITPFDRCERVASWDFH